MPAPEILADFKPLIEGYAIGAPGGVDRTPVGGGSSRVQLLWDGGKQPFQVSLRMPAEKFAVWTMFYLHIIERGTVAFTMPLDSGFGLEDHLCNIVPGTYAVQRTAGQASTVSFVVEAESAAYALTAVEAEALIAAYNGYASAAEPEIPRGFKPVIQGYSFDGPGGGFRSDLSGANPGYGGQWDRDVQQFRVTLILDAEKFAVWMAFFHHKLHKGARSFVLPLDSGMGLEDHQATLIPDTCTAARNGPVYVVSFGVEAESTAYALSAAEAETYLELWAEYGNGYGALLERLARFANEDTLVLNDL